jgi:hypothetical protein
VRKSALCPVRIKSVHRAIVLLALVALLGGCLVREVRATPADLEAARVLLREGKPVALRTEDQRTEPVQPDQNIEVIDNRGLRFTVNLRDVMHDCPDHPPEDGRLCELHNIQHVVLAHHREYDRNAGHEALAATVGIGIVGGVIGAGVCAFECEANYTKWPSRVVTAGVAALIIWAISTTKLYH